MLKNLTVKEIVEQLCRGSMHPAQCVGIFLVKTATAHGSEATKFAHAMRHSDALLLDFAHCAEPAKDTKQNK